MKKRFFKDKREVTIASVTRKGISMMFKSVDDKFIETRKGVSVLKGGVTTPIEIKEKEFKRLKRRLRPRYFLKGSTVLIRRGNSVTVYNTSIVEMFASDTESIEFCKNYEDECK